MDAHVSQEEIIGSIKDNFVLIIRYYQLESLELYMIKIRLSNTQDKADAEIIEAIQFYHTHSRTPAG